MKNKCGRNKIENKCLYFAQLAGQYGLFGILFQIQTNCSHFAEHISLKVGFIHARILESLAKLSNILDFS